MCISLSGLQVAAPLFTLLPSRLRDSIERSVGPSHLSQSLAAIAQVGVHPLVPAALAEGTQDMVLD